MADRDMDIHGLWANDTKFADDLQADLMPMLFEALQRMYDRYYEATEKPEDFEHFTGLIIAGGLIAFHSQLEKLEKELGVTK